MAGDDVFVVRQVGPWLHTQLRTIERLAGTRCPVEVLVTDSSPHGPAVYLPGLILFGRAEMDELVHEIRSERFEPIRDPGRMVWGLLSREVTTLDQIGVETWRHVLAHEYGHHEQAVQGLREDRVTLEADADHFAGLVAGQLGWQEVVGRAVFETVGCTMARDRCDHPSPRERVNHYRAGYQQGQVARLFRAALGG